MCQYENYLKIDNLLNKKECFPSGVAIMHPPKQIEEKQNIQKIVQDNITIMKGLKEMNDDHSNPVYNSKKEKFVPSIKKREIKHRTVITDEQRRILKSWLYAHYSYPYPTQEEKNSLMLLTGLNQGQINNWFVNIRRRDYMVHPWSNSRKNTSHRDDISAPDAEKVVPQYFSIQSF